MTDQKSVCLQAHELVTGDRAEQYGDPIELFNAAADIAAEITPKHLRAHTNNRQDKALQALYIMVAVKLARQAHKPKRDNLVDACGYIELIANIEDSK